MIAMTTKSSINVNPRRAGTPGQADLKVEWTIFIGLATQFTINGTIRKSVLAGRRQGLAWACCKSDPSESLISDVQSSAHFAHTVLSKDSHWHNVLRPRTEWRK